MIEKKLNKYLEELNKEKEWLVTQSKNTKDEETIKHNEKIIESIDRKINMANSIRDFKFPNDMDSATNKKLIEIIKNDFKKLTFNYTFIGKAGCGKSYLARLILDNIKKSFYEFEAGFTFLSIKDEYMRYLNSLSKKDEPYYPKLNQEFLVIDDIGIEKPVTDSAHQYVANIIETRYEHFCKYPTSSTIITTNLGSKEMVAFYGDRVVDRIFDMTTIFLFKNESYRKQNKKIIEL